jgi:tRNA(Ile)-lysidine synthase
MTRTASKPAANDGVIGEPAERLRAELERLWPEGGRLGLAVSGGPDSLALLLLAHAAIPERFAVATVNHGVRPEAAGECALVEAVCAERGIPCQSLSVTVRGNNLQSAARDARYLALGAWAEQTGLGAIATAHHADDQAETLLMRLNRASGLSGLAGVRERSHGPGFEIPVIRPLLRFRRRELAAIVARAGLDPVRDPSNLDDRFDRVRIRKALADCDWLDPVAVATSAAHLADAQEALEYGLRRAWPERVTVNDGECRYRPPLPRLLELLIAERIVASLGKTPRGQEVARLVDRLQDGKSGNLGGVLATVEGDEWLFRPEPARRC